MAQIFHRSFNTISRVSIFGAVFFVAALGWALYALDGSPYLHRWSPRLTWIVAGAAFLWLALLVGGLLVDYSSRPWLGNVPVQSAGISLPR